MCFFNGGNFNFSRKKLKNSAFVGNTGRFATRSTCLAQRAWTG